AKVYVPHGGMFGQGLSPKCHKPPGKPKQIPCKGETIWRKQPNEKRNNLFRRKCSFSPVCQARAATFAGRRANTIHSDFYESSQERMLIETFSGSIDIGTAALHAAPSRQG